MYYFIVQVDAGMVLNGQSRPHTQLYYDATFFFSHAYLFLSLSCITSLSSVNNTFNQKILRMFQIFLRNTWKWKDFLPCSTLQVFDSLGIIWNVCSFFVIVNKRWQMRCRNPINERNILAMKPFKIK